MSDVFADSSLRIVRDKIRVIMNDTADHISSGGSKCCGIIEGLALAEREILDLDKSIEEN